MKHIYLNEYNVRMGAFSYLPFVSGLLRAYCETFKEIRDNYVFMPFIYHMDEPHKILSQYTEAPDIAAFSSVMWNEQLNYHIAAKIKQKYPQCLIVFGGPNVPMPPQHSIDEWMKQHPYVDVAVRAEGEEAFADILKHFLSSRDFSAIPGVACRGESGEIQFCQTERPFRRDLSEYPSPYLTGMYDGLLEWGKQNGHEFQAIIETNRGCPFPCTFCYWGKGGLSRRFKFKQLETIYSEVDWMGKNNIRYVFNADSNFGIHNRDWEIAESIVETKLKYGFPEKFRTCFGKNTDEKIFKIGSLFHKHQLEKGITLARQSNDKSTLKNIRRDNIKMSTYINLQKQFNDSNIPVYGELILGLPGETADTWRLGVDELLEAGISNQLFIYLCQIFNNTEMAEADYIERFGIKTRRIKLAEIHGQLRPEEWLYEYEEVVVATDSMPHDDWRNALRFSYVLMLFHSLKTAYYVMIYMLDKCQLKMSQFIDFVAQRKFDTGKSTMMSNELDFYDSIIERMIEKGEHRGTFLPEYGDLYWDVEESSFLRVTQNADDFFTQLSQITKEYLKHEGVDYRVFEDELDEVFLYQKSRIPTQKDVMPYQLKFQHNFPEYFAKRFGSQQVPIERKNQLLDATPALWDQDLRRFAKETILWGRKSGTMLVKCRYSNS